ncbi:MAG: hypothetical protein IPI03_07005 [Rubrivivax sp.]|nr:hypothetical protein [Rubrivivax sp.]
MDVRIDQAGHQHPATAVDRLGIGRRRRVGNRRDALALDHDIGGNQALVQAVEDLGVGEDDHRYLAFTCRC